MKRKAPRKKQAARAESAAALRARLDRAERSLRDVQERYESAMGAINESVYDWDIAGDKIFYADQMERSLGLPPRALNTMQDWLERVHPDDLRRLQETTFAHFKGQTPRMECDYRYRAREGEWRWARSHGLAHRDGNGRAYRMIGATGDVTELKQAELERSATAEILRVMAASQGDTQPVFDAIARNAANLCGGALCSLFLFDGRLQHFAAHYGVDDDIVELLRSRYPNPPDPTRASGMAILERKTVHIEDATVDARFPGTSSLFGRTGYRAGLAVPMLKDGRTTGLIFVVRREARRFSERQIELLSTFADQALMATENVRLYNETREALEQQTATAEILKVTSGSPTDVQPVFEAILAHASSLCEASVAAVFLFDGEALTNVAQRNASPEFAQFMRGVRSLPSLDTTCRRCALERRTIHTADLLSDPEFAPPEAHRRENIRTVLSVPMMREGALAGVITLWRREVRPFAAKQIALVETFARQAVLAIESVRLANETREALEQQKALAEVLGTISGSIADAKPVFDEILDSCQRLFAGHLVGLTLLGEDGMVRLGAYKGDNREATERVYPYPVGRDSGSGQAMLDRKVIRFDDVGGPGSDAPLHVIRGSQAVGFKSIIFAPLLEEERPIGALWVGRRQRGPFNERQATLLETFADQAVIAIRTARLFQEIQEKSRQLEVASRHKSQFLANMSHELRTPLNAIIGFTRIVMRHSQAALEPKQYENLEKIQAGGQQLLALINSVLDLSKIEAGRVEVHAAEVGLGPVLEQCARTIEPLVKADAVALLREFNGQLPALYVDEEKLRQIVLNLLSNAAKFTSRGSIRLRAHAADGGVAIAVADTGIGIPADKLELIFEEFEQVDAGRTRAHGGTGLGLAIARRLARLMGGDIEVRSAPGSGSTFTLRLPQRYAA